MAGRPLGSRGGQPGLLYGLIAFAAVSVASLGLFVFQLTKNKAAESRAKTAEDQINALGTPTPYYKNEASARKTKVFAVMAEDLKKVAGRVTGAPEDVGAAVLAKADQVMVSAAARMPDVISPDDALLPALINLSAAFGQERSTREALARQVQDLQGERAALTEQLKLAQDQYNAQVANLGEQLRQAQDDKTTGLQQKDGQLRELQTALDAAEAQLQTFRREGSALAREKEIEIGQLRTVVEDLQRQILSLKPGAFDPNAILTKADGRILRAIPGSDIVYVNLGAADRIRPGMGLEVYSPARESSADLRGKASLEVVTVLEETSECRVTRRVPVQPILEGDIVVNIAFERGRQPRFVVRGDFDLNYDGIIDFNGVDEVTALIGQWGGQVVDELDESVDYVVIGLPPGGLSPGSEERVSPVVRDQMQQRELERSRFRDLVERAQKMFIPVITQNQFLFLTGYAGDTEVVQRTAR
jgi:hypothetical protein